MRRQERACTAAQPSATTTENDQPCQAGGGFRRCATLDHDGATVEDSPHFHPLLELRTPAAQALVLNRTLAYPDPRSSTAPGAKNALSPPVPSSARPLVQSNAYAADVLGSNRGDKRGEDPLPPHRPTHRSTPD